MGPSSSARPALDHRVPLGLKGLAELISNVAASRGMNRFPVAYKQKAKDDHVVAILWPPQAG